MSSGADISLFLSRQSRLSLTQPSPHLYMNGPFHIRGRQIHRNGRPHMTEDGAKIVELGRHRSERVPMPPKDAVRGAVPVVVAFDRRQRAVDRLSRALEAIDAAGADLAAARGALDHQHRRLDDQRGQLARHVERLGGIADDLNRRAARLREIEAETDRAIAMVNEGRWVDPQG